MLRTILVGLVTSLAFAANAAATPWAEKMFESTAHDFGMVARGSKVEHRFKFKNLYKETIHVASVSSSCGCATPVIAGDTLKTHVTGEIIAHYNTRAFTGQRGATITVIIDRPYFAEVQLRVKGYIRTDVVFSPDAVRFGDVSTGSPAHKTIDVQYAGRNDWKIVDVRSINPNFLVDVSETQRAGGRVGYKLDVRLKDGADVGDLRGQLTLITNDRSRERIPLYVEGRVVAPVVVSPSPLQLGTVAAGEKVTKRLVIKGDKPFKILAVDCPDDCFKFTLPQEARTLHVLPVTFTAGTKPGDVVRTIHIRTDLGEAVSPELSAQAHVVLPDG